MFPTWTKGEIIQGFQDSEIFKSKRPLKVRPVSFGLPWFPIISHVLDLFQMMSGT